MREIKAPNGYTCYRTDEDELYALDTNNMNLFKAEYYQHKEGIPDEKEVEGYVMDFDEKSSTFNFNPEKKVTIKMSLLSPIAVWLK
jgi:hypothetical protein